MKIKAVLITIMSFLFLLRELRAQDELKITYVANEGFIIEGGGKKVLIDALFDKIDADWCESPSTDVVEAMRNATPPFDNVDVIAITHKHSDHVNEKVVAAHMKSNPKGILICPEQVAKLLSGNPEYKAFNDRIIADTPVNYSDSNVVVAGISIRMLRLEHGQYMLTDTITGEKINIHRNTENLGYVMHINGAKIFHCGDANPLNEKAFTTYALNKDSIDVAFLDRVFFSRGEKGMEVVNKHINAGQIVLMHIGPGNKAKFVELFKQEEQVKVFENKMESFVFIP